MLRYIVTGLLLSLNLGAQTKTEALLLSIVNGPSPDIAELALEKDGRTQPGVKEILRQQLPVVLASEKKLERMWLLARLAGTLQIDSAIPPLCELLTKNTKSLTTTFYQTQQLTDDPIGLALSQIGEPAVQAVAKLLKTSNSSTRMRAIRVLGKMGTPKARIALQEARLHEMDPMVCSVLIDALAQ